MKKETKDRLVTIYWLVLHGMAVIGLLGLLKYLVYGTIY